MPTFQMPGIWLSAQYILWNKNSRVRTCCMKNFVFRAAAFGRGCAVPSGGTQPFVIEHLWDRQQAKPNLAPRSWACFTCLALRWKTCQASNLVRTDTVPDLCQKLRSTPFASHLGLGCPPAPARGTSPQPSLEPCVGLVLTPPPNPCCVVVAISGICGKRS